MNRDAAVDAAIRRVEWRERLFGFARPWLRDAPGRWADGAPILLYHDIVGRGEQPRDPFTVTVDAFDAQMAWLAERFTVVTVRELLARIVRGTAKGVAAVTFDDGYRSTVAHALPVLRARKIGATVFVDTGRLNSGGRALNDADVRALSDAGVEIGSHTVTHPNLTELDDASLRRELSDSRSRLSSLTGADVVGFAHPFGRYNTRVNSAVQAAGYSYACTCRQHRTNLPGDDALQLVRVEVNATDDMRRFESKMHGRYAPLYAAWYRLNPETRAWVDA
ncbi:MAG TPA: polysaccharide deacetylase family protein [Gemmatimonadaceae bacterium]|nr:polysaccharide deacetylase family protein [Gemmatimonadaceae bacterium]